METTPITETPSPRFGRKRLALMGLAAVALMAITGVVLVATHGKSAHAQAVAIAAKGCAAKKAQSDESVFVPYCEWYAADNRDKFGSLDIEVAGSACQHRYRPGCVWLIDHTNVTKKDMLSVYGWPGQHTFNRTFNFGGGD